MNDEALQLIHGRGNVFHDLGRPNPELEQFRSMLAARIIKVLDQKRLTIRKAEEITGIAAADFSRIRRVNLDRFTVDRLMGILSKLGQEVEVSVAVHSRRPSAGIAAPAF